MSGGSLDYVYTKISDAAYTIEHRESTPLQRAFAAHLRKVAEALHDLEWVYSGDRIDGDEVEAIRNVITPADELQSALSEAKLAQVALEDCIARAEKAK